MLKLIYKLGLLIFLTSCSQGLNIFPADDLNQFLPDPKTKTFFVKTYFLTPSCQSIEQWANDYLPTVSPVYEEYYFVEYDDELTLAGNQFLKNEADAIVTSHSLCSMNVKDLKCYYCRHK